MATARYSVPVLDQVTVRFGPTDHSQAELREELGRAVDVLVDEGVASDARVEPVFPGDSDDRWKGAFVVQFYGPAMRVAEALMALPGIQSAYPASPRRSY